jgi:hypothetical protein
MEYIYIRMNDQNQVSKESSQVTSTIESINILAQEGGGDSKLFPGEVLRFSPGFPLRLFGT